MKTAVDEPPRDVDNIRDSILNKEAKPMRRNIAVVLACVVLALATVPVAAHHAFSAAFDASV